MEIQNKKGPTAHKKPTPSQSRQISKNPIEPVMT